MGDNPQTPHDDLDEMLEETFPASDPPGNTVETGIGMDIADAAEPPVHDNRAAHRFEIVVDGLTAFLIYQRRPDALVLVHTEVPPPLRGRRLGDVLIRAGLAAARAEGLRVVPMCPFVHKYLQKHPEQQTP